MKDAPENEMLADTEQEVKAREGKLINEAIKRILLDIVIRGHGDRLIGRWSREPDLQHFLAEVPYLLDRISQLHLACARTGSLLPAHAHHFHHRRRHESREQELGAVRDVEELLSNSSAGWMVRTRDPLGLTPLHKAVLAENSALVKFLLDHYKNEPAGPSTRLMDAQDKYGRSALHYAAALAASGKPHRVHLYKLLLSRGASNKLRDFRGKTARDYAHEAAGQLKVRTIIHLSNRMSANYQANVLSRTLRVGLRIEGELPCGSDERVERDFSDGSLGLKSVSCAELAASQDTIAKKQPPVAIRSHSNLAGSHSSTDWLSTAQPPANLPRPTSSSSSKSSSSSQINVSSWSSESIRSYSNLSEITNFSKLQDIHSASDLERARKELLGQRCSRLVMDERAKLTCSRALNEGILERLSELLLEGYGSYLMAEAGLSCWNQQCRRYLQKVVPNLLKKLDLLHESIALNDLTAVKTLLSEEPVLARIKRPYKQAALGAVHVSAQMCRLTILAYLFARFPELIKQRDSLGATCLHWAARAVSYSQQQQQQRLTSYEWLLQHFSSQLESIEDFRGRRADYYRQQAARLSDFGIGKPKRARDPLEASDFLHHNQSVSNEIKLMGSRSRIEPRKVYRAQDARKRVTPTSSNPVLTHESLILETPTSTSITLLQEKSDPPQDNSNYNLSTNNNREKSLCKDPVGVVDGEKATVIQGQLSTSVDDSGERRHLSVKNEGKDRKLIIEDANQKASPSCKLKHEQEEKRAELLSEMLQLNADETSPEVDTTLISAKTRPVVQQSKLELMLRECLKENDFARLERLILAGYNRRILKLLESWKISGVFQAPSRKEERKVSDCVAESITDEMRIYLNNRAPELISLIERIHKLLHECFSHPENHQTQVNFHKFCNLLTCNSLVMSRNQYGATPLHVSLLRADKRLAEYLLRRQPEAASAPDHLNRNPLHYAALTLSAFRGHSKGFSITTKKALGEEQQVLRHWIVDKRTQLIYDNLCSRYRELLSICDSRGRTCEDYLSSNQVENHQQLENLSASSKDARLIKASEAFGSCCPEYAKLLDSYAYCIVVVSASDKSIDNKPPESRENQSEVKEKVMALEAPSIVLEEETNQKKTIAENVAQVPEKVLLYSEDHPESADKISDDQVQPSPTITEAEVSDLRDTKLGIISVNVAPSNEGAPVTSESPMSSSKHHHKHHHHHHHHHLHFPEGKERDDMAHQSLIGGVIVPTIIHNDKMDEIETYDIIYRQPTGSRVSPSKCNNAGDPIAKALNLPGSSAASTGAEGIIEAGTRFNKLPTAAVIQSGGRLSRSGSSISSSSSSSSSSIELDDERVERLSMEFEDRVRKEKCELRLKVDQIMSEIKLSAKSAKSARLLNSPVPATQNLDKKTQEVDRPMSGTDKSSSSTGIVMHINSSSCRQHERKRVSKHDKQPKNSTASFSLSGSSSASTRSALSNSATSCSSRSSCSSSGCSRRHDLDTPTYASTRADSSPTIQLNEKASESKMLSNTSPHQPLIKAGDQHPASKNAYGQTYLHFIASRAQSASVLYKVLDHARYLIGERDIFYRSARDVALQFNLANNVQVLDKFVIDLFVAANLPLLRHLLNQGYSPLIHVADPDGNDIMLILKLLKLDRMVHFLLMMADFQRWRDELHTFIRHGYSAGVSELIRKHKDLVRAKSLHSRTSLHLAILFDRLDMIRELLVEDSSCVHVTDNMGRTPLHYAYGLAHLANSESIREQLLAAGASLEVRDVKMRTPKYYFIFKREIEDIKKMELELN